MDAKQAWKIAEANKDRNLCAVCGQNFLTHTGSQFRACNAVLADRVLAAVNARDAEPVADDLLTGVRS